MNSTTGGRRLTLASAGMYSWVLRCLGSNSTTVVTVHTLSRSLCCSNSRVFSASSASAVGPSAADPLSRVVNTATKPVPRVPSSPPTGSSQFLRSVDLSVQVTSYLNGWEEQWVTIFFGFDVFTEGGPETFLFGDVLM